MINGLYVATSGLLMQQSRLDNISNNLANINTTGYKKDLPVFTVFRPTDKRIPQDMIRQSLYNKTINTAVMLDDIYTDHDNGHLKLTENKLDVALANKNAFFSIDTPWGVRYTRAGDFTLNENGDLVTRDGQPVVSRQSQGTANINIPPASEVSIDSQGNIYINGEATDALQIVQFADLNYLQKVGRNQFSAVDIEPTDAVNPQLKQGFLEDSNVDPIAEMVRMIDAARGYEMYSKAVQTQDDLMSQAATKISGQ